jgi:hypothetical protein
MDEQKVALPTATATWATVGVTPNISQIKIPQKSVLKEILIELSGSYEQSVGNEAFGTEGCVNLIQEVRLNLEGTSRRTFKGPMLFELNRIMNEGAMEQTDPAVGVAAGKAFSASFVFPMQLFDTKADVEPVRQNGITRGFSLRDVSARTLLDLRNYPGDVYLEIVWNPFNFYVSGNTQGSMTATIRAVPIVLPSYRRISKDMQLHFEAPIQDTVDMTATKSEYATDLLRDSVYSRALLLRCGTLAATPNVTATTALANALLKGQFKSGPSVSFADKLPPGTFRNLTRWGHNGVALRAGFVFIDHSSDKSFGGGIDGNRLAVYQLASDITGTAVTTMQVAQLVARK